MRKLIAYTLLTATIATSAPAFASAQNCTVQKGESLWKIAKEYHLDFRKVLELNEHLANPHLIHPGQFVETHADSGKGNSTAANQSEPSVKTDVNQEDQIASNKEAQAVLALVNEERTKRGLKPLKLSTELNTVATAKAKDMADNEYFSHDSPTYGSPFDMMHSFGVDYRTAGENIAAGQRSAKDVMDSWMNSSGHRANILSADYTALGIGFYACGTYGTYWVQEFTG